jgi:phosphoribosylformylglycinamidine cyclo-ligase
VVLGLPSSGLHTNGYTLARRILGESRAALDIYEPTLGRTVGEALLEPHRSYYGALERAMALLKGVAHITGGGIIGNVARILPRGLAVDIDSGRWRRPPVFDLMQQRGNVATREMYRVFNMGVGMILVSDSGQVRRLRKAVPEAAVIGQVVRPRGRVRVIIDGVGYRSDKVR